MHRHATSFSVFEASVFYQWQAHCVTQDGMRKQKIALRRVGELHTNSIELDRKMHDSMVAGAR
jgi:hypothetical protein